ncbi:AraC family transcriptional regulator [Microbispora hainanensis]|jgi:AraC-like DNA-binding protein|uniref:AraC family transcriptional regulator n=1 Tax=Microbispora hainanensis TaxID=568844 RepID=A0ABZ1SMT1_9ACTN|nr:MULTISPECIES: AraC family transcriptional regulator [Microbispora]NJP28461.1 AraC family transcriptional regulator [Microbispora sp. CL1-1]TQS08322.1 AraC family transcriptional regulator [Microbispora sp. SCL1-1]
MAEQSLPLAAHLRLRTHDVDEACRLVGNDLGVHGLRPVDPEIRLDARLNGVAFDGVGLYSLGYGTEVLITPQPVDDYLLVEIPLSGAAEVSQGRERIVATPELASVLSLTRPMCMRWPSGLESLIVRFDRAALEAHLGRLMGRTPRRPLTFSLGMDLTRPPVRSWLSVVELLRREAETGGAMLEQPVALRQLEGLLMTQLLLAQPSNYSEALSGAQPRVAPTAVERAVELIEARAAEPLTVEEIAEAVGVGARALQEGFRRQLETTPMSYLREVRLDRVRAELMVGDPGATTVTDVAYRWGFVHLGRFALAYRRRFGESPSETLRRGTRDVLSGPAGPPTR